MERDGRCDWCQLRVESDQDSRAIDGKLFHTTSGEDAEDCLKAYRLYCRFIREAGDHKDQLPSQHS